MGSDPINSCLSNAVVRKIEQISDSQVKILYGNTEDNPMFISYTGFMTEQEAIDDSPLYVC